jgi:hypothetical protein
MRQSIERNRETKPFKAAVTAMFHGRRHVLGGNESFCVRESAARSLSGVLKVISVVVSGASLLSAYLKLRTKVDPSRHRTRRRSLLHTEKFSAEGLNALSVLAVLTAIPNTRSPQAAATVITTMTEQRRCAAA